MKIGLIGLAVMGANLARNIARNEFGTCVYNRTTETMTKFIEEHGNENLVGAETLEEFVEKLEKPRKIIIMVKAGKPVDAVIEQLLPLLDQNDLIIDCGNSLFTDTKRRHNELKEKGFRYMGCGVSGGEEGALNGPSMMPGGDKDTWEDMKEIFEAIAAKDFNGKPCVTYVGEDGAGHYVKMVHNGIEYSVMQMMAEAYDFYRKVLGLSAGKIGDIFATYNDGKLKSYLFEISTHVLAKKEGDAFLVDFILDKAAQKGTGRWTAIDSLERGLSIPSITEAVYARSLSNSKELRTELNTEHEAADIPEKEALIKLFEDGLYAAMISGYAQGYQLISEAAAQENWSIDLAEVSRIWEGGCIIRAELLNTLHKAYEGSTENPHLFAIPDIQHELTETIPALRDIVALGAKNGIAMPGLATALAYYDTMHTANGPANFIQGLRDFFGAHTYERTDKEGTFHTEWEA